ncbi:hypothetical protein ANCCAN_27324 [Ancylostoma caninum]|uniref:Globin family profile domain-containing protein n=1 Tax=Ancylostoma caninum TaxID=29170 RepID=A0A368F5T9_ANCCA|nr:hypothetical protein ANCCAN_27324 [Ancylostoma caninum]
MSLVINRYCGLERNKQHFLYFRYLNQHPENTSKYPKLKNVDGATVDVSCNNPGFETVAANYLKVFDDVISAVEEKPGDVQPACDRLVAVGKMHRSKVNTYYLFLVPVQW